MVLETLERVGALESDDWLVGIAKGPGGGESIAQMQSLVKMCRSMAVTPRYQGDNGRCQDGEEAELQSQRPQGTFGLGDEPADEHHHAGERQ